MADFYIFRNTTCELICDSLDAKFSGYDDIHLPLEGPYRYFLWFYTAPIITNSETLIQKIIHYQSQLSLVVSQLPATQTILLMTMAHPNVKTISIKANNCLRQAISNYNNELMEIANQNPNVKLIPFTEFTQNTPHTHLIDWKYFFVAQSQINPILADTFSKWFKRQLKQIELIRHKCIILDLDNTLWGGVLGEDGIDGIKIGGAYPGNAFEFFQKSLLELRKSGILLAVCSKNNETDVMHAWENNPYIVIKKEHLSAFQINWENKANNIMAIANTLNIGLDSIVFVDDNPSERELVKQALPAVSVPNFPEQPYLLPSFFDTLIDNYFGIYALTQEDKLKSTQYAHNNQRNELKLNFKNMDDYLKSLNIALTIQKATNLAIPRIAQLSQKTNQFNLTTIRYTESDIQKMCQSNYTIYTLSVSDRFGDSGLTGVIIFKLDNAQKATIETYMLSCRILGKEIENIFILETLRLLKSCNIENIHAQYRPTERNSQTKDFFDRMGFNCMMENKNQKDYQLNLANFKYTPPINHTVKVLK